MGVTDKKIVVVGYGNQGKAWAKNLRDSGWVVSLSGRPGGVGQKSAAAENFEWIHPDKLKDCSDIIALLLPDDAVENFFAQYFSDEQRPAQTFAFAHGYAVTYDKVKFNPTDTACLVAPKGLGVKLRENYKNGSGVMGVLGVSQDPEAKAWDVCNNLAHGLGLDRVGIIKSTFKEETYCDLFSEQALLCGSVPRLLNESVKYLVAKGIDPQLATYECLHELKLVVDLMTEKGISGMYQAISSTARYGGLKTGQRMIETKKLAQDFDGIWNDVTSDEFVSDMEQDLKSGNKNLTKWMNDFEGNEVDKNL